MIYNYSFVLEIMFCFLGEMLVNLTDAWNDIISPNLTRIIYNFPLQQRMVNNRREMISLVTELRKQHDIRLKVLKLHNAQKFNFNSYNTY